MPAKNNILNAKQKKFCDVYLSTNNLKKAIDEAGYKVSSPSRIFEAVAVGKHLISKGISREKISKLILDGKVPTVNLTMKELKFCNLYLASGDINRSAIKAGYAISRHGHADIVRRKHIVNYLKERRKKMESNTNVTAARLIGKLSSIVDSVVGDNKDEVDKEYASLAISAIKTINDMMGYNAPQSTIVQNVGEDSDMKKLRELTFRLLEKKRQEEKNHGSAIEYKPEPK